MFREHNQGIVRMLLVKLCVGIATDPKSLQKIFYTLNYYRNKIFTGKVGISYRK